MADAAPQPESPGANTPGSGLPPGFDPSLLMTLMGMNSMMPSEAENRAQLEHLRQQVTEARSGAAKAGTAYQEASNQPAPDTGGQNFISSLLSGVGSVVSKNPSYEDAATQHGRQMQADAMSQRVQSLQALRDNYDQRAQAAEKLGDLEAAGQMRIAQDRTTKTMQALLLSQHGLQNIDLQKLKDTDREKIQGDMENLKQKGRMALVNARLWGTPGSSIGSGGAAAETPGENLLNQHTFTTAGGIKVADLNQFSGPQKAAMLNLAATKGYISVDKDGMDQLRAIQTSRGNLDSVMSQLSDKLPVDAADRIRMTPGITFSQMLQTDADRGAFKSWRNAAVEALKATANQRGVRLSLPFILMVADNDIPQLNDTWETAMTRVENLRKMMNHIEQSITTNDWSGMTTVGGAESPSKLPLAPPGGAEGKPNRNPRAPGGAAADTTGAKNGQPLHPDPLGILK